MELNEKILKSIKESLPELAAKELKEFIEEANASKIKLEQALKANKEAVELINSLKEKEAEFNKATELVNSGVAALNFARARERELALNIKDEQIKQRDFVINKFDSFLNNLVKNPRAIEIISQHGSMPVERQYNNATIEQQPFYSNTNVTKDETKD